MYRARAIPDRIEIEGPEGEVSAVEHIETEPVRLDDQVSSFTALVSALPRSPDVRVLSPQRPEVRVEIDAAAEEKTFEDIGVQLAGLRYESEVTPSTVRVLLAAPPGVLARLTNENLTAVAAAGGLEPRARAQEVPVEVRFADLPARDRIRINIVSVEPSDVRVLVTEREITQ
jgi:hypothetical protein